VFSPAKGNFRFCEIDDGGLNGMGSREFEPALKRRQSTLC
jgi:hypothetical protein